ncbi:MAG: dihydroorotate dehydrogenase [Spirochaeta sp.]|nr:dihydroorotate dehydrogenase [Spirochaeta sp.]
MIDLRVEVAGVTLRNPVMPASGCFEITPEQERVFDPAILGAIVNKTLFLRARKGNPPPRIWETPGGMLNSIGIPGQGVEAFIEHKLGALSALGPPLIVSIAGNSVEEFCRIAGIIEETGKAQLLELNLSCPNLNDGLHWATRKETLFEVVSAVTQATSLPVAAKLSPAVTDIVEMAATARKAGAAALSLVNTFKGLAIDIEKKRPLLGNITGGLSGPAIRPLALYCVYEVYKRVDIPIIGMGGITGWRDAVEFILAGATAVAVGMYNFVNPLVMAEVIEGIDRYLVANSFSKVKDIIGLAHRI